MRGMTTSIAAAYGRVDGALAPHSKIIIKPTLLKMSDHSLTGTMLCSRCSIEYFIEIFLLICLQPHKQESIMVSILKTTGQ